MNGDIQNLRLVLNASPDEWKVIATFLHTIDTLDGVDQNEYRIVKALANQISNATNSTVTSSKE